MASRSTVERGRGTRRATAITSARDQAQQRRTPRRAADDEDDRDLAVVGSRDRERRERCRRHRGRDDIARARQAPLRRDLVAKQRRDRHVVGAAERPQRKGRGRQHAIGQRQAELARMDGAGASGSGMRRRTRRDHKWQRGADSEPDHDADPGQQQHFDEIDGNHPAAGGADRLHGGDHVALAVEIMPGGIGDADAADQQRGQADQRQILGEPLDVAFELRRRIGAAADFPARLRQLRIGGIDHVLHGTVAGAPAGSRRR